MSGQSRPRHYPQGSVHQSRSPTLPPSSEPLPPPPPRPSGHQWASPRTQQSPVARTTGQISLDNWCAPSVISVQPPPTARRTCIRRYTAGGISCTAKRSACTGLGADAPDRAATVAPGTAHDRIKHSLSASVPCPTSRCPARAAHQSQSFGIWYSGQATRVSHLFSRLALAGPRLGILPRPLAIVSRGTGATRGGRQHITRRDLLVVVEGTLGRAYAGCGDRSGYDDCVQRVEKDKNGPVPTWGPAVRISATDAHALGFASLLRRGVGCCGVRPAPGANGPAPI